MIFMDKKLIIPFLLLFLSLELAGQSFDAYRKRMMRDFNDYKERIYY